MPSNGVLSQAHYAVIVFVGSTVLRGVHDVPEVGVVGSGVDADYDALSGYRSDSPGRVGKTCPNVPRVQLSVGGSSGTERMPVCSQRCGL